MTEKIIERIIKKSGTPDLFETLVNRLSMTDLQSLLLEVYRERVKQYSPADLLRQYSENRFVRPAKVNPKEILAFDLFAFALLPADFEILELSPVSPLGSNTVLAPVNQNNTISTIRSTEVCSDNTTVMALECAHRRKQIYSKGHKPDTPTKLCSSHRLLRAQNVEGPATFPHFRIFSLCTAGRDRGTLKFETESLLEHLTFYTKMFLKAEEFQLTVNQLKICLTAFDETLLDQLQKNVMELFKSNFPNVNIYFDQTRQSGRNYYEQIAFQIYAKNPSGQELLLVDGGFNNWTQKLLSNRKERLLTSGLGSERLLWAFK